MKLIDRDDFNAIGRIGAPYDLTLNEDGSQDPGPFLFLVNDKGAWIRRYDEDSAGGLLRTARIDYATATLDSFWKKAADLWVEGSDISRNMMIRRYRRISQVLRSTEPGEWLDWSQVYHWREGSEIMWEGLEIHPSIMRRDEPRRQVARR